MTIDFFTTQFASSGDTNSIPVTPSGTASISIQEGFNPLVGVAYPSGIGIDRGQMNELFATLWSLCAEIQVAGCPLWQDTIQYQIGSRVSRLILGNYIHYSALTASLGSAPEDNPTAWGVLNG